MASFDVAAALHAQRHAQGQPDQITPESIGAQPLQQDTGWLEVDALPSKMVPSFQRLRRVGDRVIFTFKATVAETGETGRSTAFPDGFRPGAAYEGIYQNLNLYVYGTHAGALTIASSGTIALRSVTATTSVIYVTMDWFTDDAWPTILPGAPA